MLGEVSNWNFPALPVKVGILEMDGFLANGDGLNLIGPCWNGCLCGVIPAALDIEFDLKKLEDKDCVIDGLLGFGCSLLMTSAYE